MCSLQAILVYSECLTVFICSEILICCRRGMAALVGKDVSKLKAKGGGKWKYMSEKDMIEISEKFTPYR